MHLAGWRAALDRADVHDAEVRGLASLVTVGLLIAHAALRREESRGGHFRSDFPERDDVRWNRHVADVRSSSRGD